MRTLESHASFRQHRHRDSSHRDSSHRPWREICPDYLYGVKSLWFILEFYVVVGGVETFFFSRLCDYIFDILNFKERYIV